MRPSGSELEPLFLGPLEERPLVSILVANYNYERFIGQALQSLTKQTYDHFDAIVCDDGSDDDSCEVVEHFRERDSRIRLVRKTNGGVGSALNRAYSESRGSLLCILDADDFFHPEKLASVVAAFQAQRLGLLVHPLMVIDSENNEIQQKPAFDIFEKGWIAEKIIERGGRWMYMEASAVCFRREIAEIMFPLDEDRFRTWADTYICILGGLLAPVGYVYRPLAYYRLHGSNLSGYTALGAEQANRGAQTITRVVDGVQTRLWEVGKPTVIDVARNLSYQESSLQAALFGGYVGRLFLLRRFIGYAMAVIRDDIYSPARKLLALFFLGSSIVLPVQLRARWVSAGMTESAFKERVRAAISKVA